MKTIHLPTDHVQFGKLANLIASALHPLGDDSSDREMMAWGGARGNLEAELLKAVKTGALPVKDPITKGPHTFPFGDALSRALVSVDDLRDFLTGRGVAVEVAEPQPAPATDTATPAPVADGEWITQAQARAREIIKESRAQDRYPSQENISDRIAAEFRKSEIFGSDGKPLSGAYIKRHALKGISSAKGKQLSTTIGRGK